jgi:hypothetical protein
VPGSGLACSGAAARELAVGAHRERKVLDARALVDAVRARR